MMIGDKVRIAPGVGSDPARYRYALGIGVIYKITAKRVLVDWPSVGKRHHSEKNLEIVSMDAASHDDN